MGKNSSDRPASVSSGPDPNKTRTGRVRSFATIVIVIVIVFGAGFVVGHGGFTIGGNKSVSGLPNNLDYSSVNTVYKALKESLL